MDCGLLLMLHRFSHSSAQGLVWVENEGKQPCSCSSQMPLVSASWLFFFSCFRQLFLFSLTTSPFLFSFSLHFPLGLFYPATWQCVCSLMQIITDKLDSFLEAASSWITVPGKRYCQVVPMLIFSSQCSLITKMETFCKEHSSKMTSISHRPRQVHLTGSGLAAISLNFPTTGIIMVYVT